MSDLNAVQSLVGSLTVENSQLMRENQTLGLGNVSGTGATSQAEEPAEE